MLNSGIKQEFDDYKKKAQMTKSEMMKTIEVLSQKFEKSLQLIDALQVNLTHVRNFQSDFEDTRSEKSINSMKSVHFHYYLSSKQYSDGVLKFDSLVSSSSDYSYSPKTGKFVAPYDGTYFFIVNIHADISATSVEIYIDNMKKTRMYVKSASFPGSSSLTIHLNQRQELYVKQVDGRVFGDSNKPNSSIQGFLINS